MSGTEALAGDFGLELTFVQLRPGSEFNVEEQLSKVFPKSVKYKCFGKFDLLTVSQMDTLGDLRKRGDTLGGIHPDILQVNRVLCFAFDHPASIMVSNEIFLTYRLAGVCFLKFQSDALRKYGPKLYERILSHLHNNRLKLESDAHALYGSLGWSELVIFLFSSNPTSVLKDVLALGNLTLPELGFEAQYSVFVDTFTVPCVEYSYLHSLLYAEQHGNLKPNRVDNLNTYLNVACKSGYSSYEVADKISEYFETVPEPAYGKTDFLVRPQLPFEMFVARLLRFRRDEDVKKHVFSTSSIFTLKESPKPRPLKTKSPQTIFKDVQMGDRLMELALSDESLCRGLEDCFAGLSACLSDEVLSEVFLDLVPFVSYLLDRGENELDRPFQKAELSNVVEAFAKAFRQRFLGSHLTLFEITELVLTYQGGVHRILQAVNLIPYALLKDFGESWIGFTVFGLRGQYMRYSFGIMNLPYECLFDPARWFGLLHEIGHDFFHKKGVLQKDELAPFLKSRGIESIEQPDELTEEQVKELRAIEETFADIFDFLCGFRGDWDLYRDNVLAYVFSNWPERSLGYARRAFVIYLHHRTKDRPDLLASATAKHYEEILSELWNELKSHSEIGNALKKQKLVELNPELSHQIIGYYMSQSNLLRWSVDFIARSRTVPQASASVSESSLTALKNGIVLDTVPDPAGVLLHFIRERDQKLRTIFAFFMSFSLVYCRVALPTELPRFILTRRANALRYTAT